MVRENRATNAQRELSRAQELKAQANVKVAARYMYLKGWSIESALYLLTVKK